MGPRNETWNVFSLEQSPVLRGMEVLVYLTSGENNLSCEIDVERIRPHIVRVGGRQDLVSESSLVEGNR